MAVLALACGGGGGGETPKVDPGGSNPPANTPADTPVSVSGFLKITNGQITSDSGDPIQLKGMSFYWSNWGAAFLNVSAVDQAVDYLGCQIVRAPLAVGNTNAAGTLALDVNGGYITNPEANKARVKEVVDEAIYKGVYVIIDWHDSAAETRTELAKTYFAEMAATYKDVPNVIFEIYNEPLTSDWTGLIKPYSEAVIKVIRDAGANNLILVGTGYFSQGVAAAAADPVSDTNVAYVMHFYAGTPSHAALRGAVDTVMAGGKAVFVSEWGTCDASGTGVYNEAASLEFLNWMDTKKISWCNWSMFDKAETASMFVPGTSPVGPWSDMDLTTDGKFVKAHLPAPTSQLSIGPSLLNFFYGGGEQTVSITTAGNWAASSGNPWLTFSPASGSGNASFTVTASTNPDATPRTGVIEFTGPNGSKAHIVVKQRANDGNLAAGQPTTSSADQDPSYKAAYATDGDEATRWSSAYSDPQWLQVDLGQSYDLAKVVLLWEAAVTCSTNFQIQVSDTAVDGTWTTIYPSDPAVIATGTVGGQTIILNGKGRYIRLYSLSRAGAYGNSLWEFKVYAVPPPDLSFQIPPLVSGGNTAALDLMRIPAGTFTMGAPDSDVAGYANERPQHSVTISESFYMGKYEVTKNQWISLFGSNPSLFPDDWSGPVEGITYDDITKPGGFLERLNTVTAPSRPTGLEFRLPTEAEWEYACRAGTTTRFYWGDDPSYTNYANYAWCKGNSGNTTHPVGKKAPNAWWLYDMAGNASEFVQDLPNDYTADAQTDPTGPVKIVATAAMTFRTLRGGPFYMDADLAARSAARDGIPNGDLYRYNYEGFRVVLGSPRPQTLKISNTATVASIPVQSDLGWSAWINSGSEWLSVVNANGVASQSVDVNVAANASGSGRTGSVQVKIGDTTYTVAINQLP